MRSKRDIKKNARLRKKKHINKVVSGTAERPRLVVFKSLKHIYAQLVDDANQKTITGMSSLSKELLDEIKSSKNKLEVATIIGKSIGKKAQAMKIERVVFDRNGYLYHGRIKAVADGAREAGLKL
jgi:large subunit ribosomal protein L18